MLDPLLPTAPAGQTSPAGAAGTAAQRGAGATAEAGAADFTAMVSELASNAAGLLKNAEAVSIAGVQGKATVQQVVEAVMAAEQTLQGAIAIRDKVVAAYLEVSRMQI